MNRRIDELAFARIKSTMIAEGYTDNDTLQDLAIIEGSLNDYYRKLKEDEETTKKLKALEILKIFGFVIEDYTEELNGSVCVNQRRIILDDDEIDLLKEVIL